MAAKSDQNSQPAEEEVVEPMVATVVMQPAPMLGTVVEGYLDEEIADEIIYTTITNATDSIEITAGETVADMSLITSTEITSAKIDYDLGHDVTIGTGNVSSQHVWFISTGWVYSADNIGPDPSDQNPTPGDSSEYSESEKSQLSSIAGFDDTSAIDDIFNKRIDELLLGISTTEIPLKSFNRVITKGKL